MLCGKKKMASELTLERLKAEIDAWKVLNEELMERVVMLETKADAGVGAQVSVEEFATVRKDVCDICDVVEVVKEAGKSMEDLMEKVSERLDSIEGELETALHSSEPDVMLEELADKIKVARVEAAEAGVGAGAEAGVEASSRLPSSSSKGTDKGNG